MKTKIWYRDAWRPFEAGGPWLVGKTITEATVISAEANSFGTLYMVITKDGRHENVRKQQILYSQVGNAKRTINLNLYDAFPFTDKKVAFWYFMKTSALLWAVYLFIMLFLAFTDMWPVNIILGIMVIFPIMNLLANYKDYKESLQYFPKANK